MTRFGFILSLLTLVGTLAQQQEARAMHLKAAIMAQTDPMAYVDEEVSRNSSGHLGETRSNFPRYQGYLPDLLRLVQEIALERDNVTLTFDFEEAQASAYSSVLHMVEQDCNTTENENLLEDCNKYDLVVADYYAFPQRSIDTHLTPPFLTTAAATAKNAKRQKRDINVLSEAETLQEPVCLLENSYYDQLTLERHPDLIVLYCQDHEHCIEQLKAEECVLFVEDELQLRHYTKEDPQLEVTRETFAEQFVVMPMNKRVMPATSRDLFNAWIYRAKNQGWLENLYAKYFRVNFCPLGKSGSDCLENCSPSNGVSNRFGECVCDSTRWTGDDCDNQVEVDYNWFPNALVWSLYSMASLNYLICGSCAIWLFFHRKRAQVSIAQPYSLALILLGCVLSTSAIIAMAQEDVGGNGEPTGSSVTSCAFIPWLYSVGFSITFGTLYAKIRRIYIIMQSAVEMRRVTVTFKETLVIVGIVLLFDVTILTVWTVVDPLTWGRSSLQEDKYGYVLESEGYCQSEHLFLWTSLIGIYHFLLVISACYMCYLARNLPVQIGNGRNVVIAIISNLQIYIVAVPVIFIVGSAPESSFFVRSVVIFMNDFVVLCAIFGDLIYQVYTLGNKNVRQSSQQCIQSAIHQYAQEASTHGSGNSNVGDNSNRWYLTGRLPPSVRVEPAGRPGSPENTCSSLELSTSPAKAMNASSDGDVVGAFDGKNVDVGASSGEPNASSDAISISSSSRASEDGKEDE